MGAITHTGHPKTCVELGGCTTEPGQLSLCVCLPTGEGLNTQPMTKMRLPALKNENRVPWNPACLPKQSL